MTTEIGAKLTLNDEHAMHALEQLKGGFEHVTERVHEVQKELTGMLKQAVATAAGFQFDRGIESLKELGHEVFAAAQAAGAEKKELAGLLAMSDRTGKGFEQLKGEANELHEELELMGIKSGVATTTMIDAFSTVAERSQMSGEKIKELVGQMGVAGKALPGGAESLAAAFRDLETGIVRPKNALVSLIKMTGTMDGSSKDIAKGLSGLVQAGKIEEATKIAEAAIGKMANKMKDVPLGFGAAVQSLKDLREQIFENVGEPMVKALGAPLLKLRTYFLENKEKFEEYAHMVGTKVGEWMTDAAGKMEDGFKYLQSHAKEIKNAIEAGVGAAKAVVTFILDHKEEIALAFGAKMAVSGVGAVAGLAGQAASGLIAAGSGGVGMVGGAGAAAGAGGLAGAALAASAAAAAVVSWMAVAEQANKLGKETGGFKTEAVMNYEAQKRALEAMAASGKGTSAEFGKLKQQMTEFAESQRQWGKTGAASADEMEKGIEAISTAYTASKALQDEVAAAEKYAAAGDTNAMPMVLDAWSKAVKDKNSLVQGAAVDVIAKSQELQNALATSGMLLTDQYAELLEQLHAKGILVPVAGKGGEGKTPPAPITNFNGPMTIHQDFKDQDPDRIAIVFRRDLVKHATARIQARTQTPFGM